MKIEDYNKWIELLKTKELFEKNLDVFKSIFEFSPEKFIKNNGLDESFIKEFQSERKIIHNRIIAFEKIEKLKKRKVREMDFFYSGEIRKARVCVCVNRFKNEISRSKGGYDFYETIHYNYAVVHDMFLDRESFIIFDEKDKKVYSTMNEFDKHFIDIREDKINSILI